MTSQYVNYLGAELALPQSGQKPKRVKKDAPVEYRKGWRVVGVSQAMVDIARAKREAERDIAMRHNALIDSGEKRADRMEVPPPFDQDAYVANAKGKPVRAKPYEIPEAAQLCATMARNAGWQRVVVEEMKKSAQGQG